MSRGTRVGPWRKQPLQQRTESVALDELPKVFLWLHVEDPENSHTRWFGKILLIDIVLLRSSPPFRIWLIVV